MTPEAWGVLILGILGAVGAKELIPGLIRHMTGAQDREKIRVRALIEERDNAESRSYECSLDRSDLQEYAIRLRAMLVAKGVDVEDLPAWPVRRGEDV